MTSERFESLEIALAHAEAEIADLSETCSRQWAEIDALKHQIAKLTRSLEAMAAEPEDAPDPDQRPPHY
ncbi:SlyX family protein [Pikeienuella piscinae]|uniref:SlyX family protein n=1 Tax=Pikeienuella piscinae TaxID=2748098 RepID=A0A7L5BVS1_9RHOB|nr:SlyX family protein [Pikeienuella piscinae]QIE55501.1 SlyX family protein [Pikeienuella piscinae]